MAGSAGVTPKRKLRRRRTVAAAPAMPATIPPSTGVIPCRTTSARTCADSAPRAMRMPISDVRRAMFQERTPYSPTDASRSATAANTLTSSIVKRRCATDSSRNSSMVLTPNTGSSRSSSLTTCRTPEAMLAGFPSVFTTSEKSFQPSPSG